MIEVDIKVHDEGESYLAMRLLIANTGDHPKHPEIGNYRMDVVDSLGRRLRNFAMIKGHVRRNGIVTLIKLALKHIDLNRDRIETLAPSWARAMDNIRAEFAGGERG